ncbi:MAG: hypothetical protein ROZ37_01625 [Aromatoleum sp.]|jgi:hypothetical protein|uniref:hypothetical protein n=1 Tax=Aromatoleum sp. TaxID=2307007 RepID=UPI002893F772|nr:hypothetical protein [Aromatoleum sp.]MDT3669014.1 hypothetical protein [Aromatoleum sp.]
MSDAPTPDLLFADPPPAGGDLLFGASSAPSPSVVRATLAVGLPLLQLAVSVARVRRISLALSLPALQMRAAAQWDSRTERPLAHNLAAPHQQAERSPAPALRAPHDQAAPLAVGAAVRHEDGAPAGEQAALHHRDAGHTRTAATSRHADGSAVRAHRAAPHQDSIHARRQILARHREAAGLRVRRSAQHEDALRLRRSGTSRFTAARSSGLWQHAAHGPALPAGRWLAPEHQDARRPPPGRYVLVPPVTPPPQPFEVAPDLLFCQPFPTSADLLFGWVCGDTPAGTVVIPIREVYLVINSFALVRADTGEPVEVETFSASLDVDSWCWGWSANLPASLMPLVRSPALGEHVELIATLNGTPLRLVVERMARDRRFGASMLRISGRSRAAWLADPHAPIATRYNTAAYTAQQLLADALTVNGVSIGWSLDWRIADWLVPAGAWSHTGTYMDAATRLAEAGGGYVQAHDSDQTLIVLPRYPAAPWNWAAQTPDIDLPEDVCEVEGIEWQDKPAYNAVWVTGGESGRRDRIRRAGTAADRTAPTLVDPLATAPEMTRARGLAVLADTGRQAHISLRLPVLPETGIIRPGKLVRYTEGGNTHLGLTRAVQLEQRFPDLWQTIKVETHELEPI